MAQSGIPWIDAVFDWCVIFLFNIANLLNISYEEVNVWLFCLAWPLLTTYQTLRIMYLKRKTV